MKALVTGGTGFVGTRLLKHLHRPVVLSRNAQRARSELAAADVTVFEWNATQQPAPAEAFEGVDVIFHLAGDNVAQGRWTKAKKRRIYDSRILGTRHLVQTFAQLANRPRVLVSASAVGYYGDHGEEKIDETTAPADTFLGQVCVDWEAEALKATEQGVRVVNPRIGVVLGEGGGALPQMLQPFKWGMGAPLGSGKQWMPWIHLHDLVRLLLFAADKETLSGPVNAASPQPVRNREFTKIAGRVLGKPTFMPAVPGFMLRVMLGGFADVLLESQRIEAKAALDAGFQFEHEEVEEALRDILHESNNR